jgi:hypothetical protein
MGKFSEYERAPFERPYKVHPIWRGIGCVLMVILPIMAYFGAVELVQANLRNNWVNIPPEFRGPAQYPYLFSYIGVGVLLLVLGFGILIVLYSLMMYAAGGQKRMPLDAPPPKRQKRRR